MTPNRFYIEEASKNESKLVTLRGWVYNKRSSGKIKFLILRDGTGLLQGVLFKGECADEAFDIFEKLTQESSVEVTGVIRSAPSSPVATRWESSPSGSFNWPSPIRSPQRITELSF